MPFYSEHMLIKAAEYYYIDKMTQQEIAKKMNINRVKVSRLLTRAEKNGLVDIRLKYPLNLNIQLERIFEKEFGIKEAIIIGLDSNSAAQYFNEVARFSAEYLLNNIRDGDVLGVTWGKTLKNITGHLKYSGKNISIFQMLGYIGDLNSYQIVSEFSKNFNSKNFLIPVPAIVENIKTKVLLMSDKKILEIFKNINRVNIAITSIGNLSKESTFVSSGYLSEEDLDILNKYNVIGEFCGVFFNIDGTICNNSVTKRIIGIDFKNLSKIPNLIGVVSGPEKAEAILGALRTKAFDVLITDIVTASKVIKKIKH